MTLASQKYAADYIDLAKRFPPRPLRTKADCEAASEVLDDLAGREDLAPGQSDYLDALTHFVEAYDDEHSPVGRVASSPADLLRALVEHRGMSVTAPGEVIDSKGVASELLSGKRSPSKGQIVKLARFFGVDPGAFFGPTGIVGRTTSPARGGRAVENAGSFTTIRGGRNAYRARPRGNTP